MKITISAAVSLDGCMDDNTSKRLKLSSPEDWEQVKELRVECDAILVGAETVRKDNSSLVIEDKQERAKREELGMEPDITKVTITKSGKFDPKSNFFQKGKGKKIVFATPSADKKALQKIEPYAEVVITKKITAKCIESQLEKMGYKSLMVEGGSGVLTMFFEEGVVDHFRLAIAPLFVGDTKAPRLVNDGPLMWNKGYRMVLDRVEKLGDTAVMHYVNNRNE